MISEFLNLITFNRELIKIFYGIFIGIICLIIVYKTDKLYRISLHKGIRYFRNAFLFYAMGFIIRYFFGSFLFKGIGSIYFLIVNTLFEFFLVLAGFFLLYSLLWKKIETYEATYSSSLLNSKIAIFYILTIMIVLLDYLWTTYCFMFFSQMIIFIIASIISFFNYKRNGRKHKFLKFYFIAMILSLITWILNFLAALYFKWNNMVLIEIYSINLIIFVLFLWGIIRVTRIK